MLILIVCVVVERPAIFTFDNSFPAAVEITNSPAVRPVLFKVKRYVSFSYRLSTNDAVPEELPNVYNRDFVSHDGEASNL